MQTASLRRAAATLVVLSLVFGVGSVRAQDVHILPPPDHPHPNAIFLASARLSLDIQGGVAHATLTQVFANPNPWRAEGIYLFPLPEGATVTDFRLTMDGEPVKGEVLDSEQARRIYLDIVRRIKDPALLEWVGNRVFRARIFPFDPGGERTLTLSYSLVLPREGDFRVYRYLTGQGNMQDQPPLQVRSERPIPPSANPPPPMPRNDPAVLQRPGRSARFVVEGTVRSDRAIRSVYSPTHSLAVDQKDPVLASFSAEGALRSREGFVLYYATAEDEDVGFSLLTHRPPGEDGYFLITISPGWRNGRTRSAKNIVFVLDTSGSMEGDNKLRQATEALDFGLSTLGDEDRFAIVTYSSSVRAWRDQLEPARAGTVEQARAFIRTLAASGGTNIEGALRAAAELAMQVAADGRGSEAPTYIIFLTDGLPTVGEDDPDVLIGLAGEHMPRGSRLFTWGVGYDVNTFLLDRLAGEQGGRAAYVEPNEDLEVKVSAFFELISEPVLTDLTLDIAGGDVYDLFPSELRDLFRGTDVTVMGRFRARGSAQIRLRGRERGTDRRITRTIELPARAWDAGFLAPMWAQRKVGYLLEQIRLNGESAELKAEIVELGERFGIVTPYTAYVVIEDRMRITAGMAGDEMLAPAIEAARSMAREAQRDRAASVYAGAAGARQQVGNQAVSLSKAEQILQEADFFQRLDFVSVQRVDDKTFRLDQETGIWKDSELEPEQSVRTVQVGSDEFERLLNAHNDLGRFAALGIRVQVVLDGQAWQIELPEEPPRG